jgi:acetyl esterase/lipase
MTSTTRSSRLLLIAGLSFGCSRESPSSGAVGQASTAAPASASAAPPAAATKSTGSLSDARRGFATTLARREAGGEPAPNPPPNVLRQIRYPAPPGELVAYLTPAPTDGKRHPAIVWISGGDGNTIGDVWSPATRENDQTAGQFRDAGFVVMYPSLRGGNDNPGAKEGLFGEVDDVIAAGEYLRKQAGVDPERIYLGGHSTGGTLVLLVAECSDRFRAVFSFGPVSDVTDYPPDLLPFDRSDPRELELRSPGRWLHSLRVPVFVFEGMEGGNAAALADMARTSTNPLAHFLAIPNVDHFSVLAPMNELIAETLLSGNGDLSKLALTQDEVNLIFGR